MAHDALWQQWPLPPFLQFIGASIVEWRQGYIEMDLPLVPELLNLHGAAHGGVSATLIDVAGAFAGCYEPENQKIHKAVTLALTSNYLLPADTACLRAVGRVLSMGSKIYTSQAEVFAANGDLCVVGQGTYRRVGSASPLAPGSSSSEPAR